MSQARFHVVQAGPLVSFQDGGRPGHLRYGVPASGPMDSRAFAAVNAALGRAAGATTIEISLGGLVLDCIDGAATFAITGGDFDLRHSGRRMNTWSVATISAGDRLSIKAGPSGSWAYLAIAGDIDAPKWLDHTATHLLSGFGGGSLATDQTLMVHQPELREDRHGPIARLPAVDGDEVHVVMGPQLQHFQAETIETFTAMKFSLTSACDRMGYRLDCPKLDLNEALSIPSEPVLPGAIQVSGDGVPTVLMADHQTTGGYPKIATVISSDLDRLVQRRAGDAVSFVSLDPDEAIEKVRGIAIRDADYLKDISTPRGSLDNRLARENLISGVVADDS